ncbi:MAG TPA: winged helix-turn-helix domain-containing protein [Solirubrobacterales bacterium]
MDERTRLKPVDKKMIRVLAHPLRVQLMAILTERIASPEEISEDLGKPLSSVTHHTKVLEEHNLIKQARVSRRTDGATERFFRATSWQLFTDDDWEVVPRGLRPAITKVTLQALLNDVDEAMAHGTFDELDDHHLSRTPMEVDKQGWDDVVLLLADTLDRVLEIQAEASARLAAEHEEGMHTKVAMMHFKSPQAKFH